jgi:hypothetical protein
MPQEYDIQQVCENGHQITAGYNTRPEERKKFCQECGAPTITSCPECHADIEGAPIEVWHTILDARTNCERRTFEDVVSVPKHCVNCGKPYPWTKKKIQTAIQIFAEFGNLNSKEKETIAQDIENIAKEVPETELSAMRIKRIWGKYGPIAYNVMMDFTSRTAAHMLKNP